MTHSMPISYFFNRQVIHYVNDGSYNIPSIGDEITIDSRIFTVESKILKPYEEGKRQYFIDLKPKENV